MLIEFIQKKMNSARYKKLEDGSYLGDISSVHGVWANAKTLSECKKELREVLEDWMLLNVYNRKKIVGLRMPVSA